MPRADMDFVLGMSLATSVARPSSAASSTFFPAQGYRPVAARGTGEGAGRSSPRSSSKCLGIRRTNPKGWDDAPGRRCREDVRWAIRLKPEETSHYTEQGVRVIRLQNIGVGYLNNEDKAFVSYEHFASLLRHRCLPGDVIIGTLGDPNLRAIVLPHAIGEALNKADCVQFRCRREFVMPDYVCSLMNMPSTLTMAASLVQGITRTRIRVRAKISTPDQCRGAMV